MPARALRGEEWLTLGLLLLLTGAVVYPLVHVLGVALVVEGRPTLGPLLAFFRRPLFLEALGNTLVSGALAVLGGSVIALPLALLSVRYRFPGRSLVRQALIIPLIVPTIMLGFGLMHLFKALDIELSLVTILIGHATYVLPYAFLVTTVLMAIYLKKKKWF